MDADYVIVGAGVSGLTAALAIKSRHPQAKVKVIESSDRPGGLLQSVEFDGLFFDLGTHVPELTSVDGLNRLIFPNPIPKSWIKLNALSVGHFFDGVLNSDTQFVHLDQTHPLFCQALTDLLQTDYQLKDADNLEAFLLARYGATLAQKILAPLVEKMTAQSLKDLAPHTVQFYGLSRIALGNRQTAINLKQVPSFDQVLAFANDTERPRPSQWLYPGSRGVGDWVQFIYQSCLQQGVEFLFGHKLKHFTQQQGVGLVTTSEAVELTTRRLVWTLPFYVGLQGGEHTRFVSRSIAIYHFYSEQAANTDCHYIYCQQADMHAYRLTFYDNVVPKHPAKPYRVTVEVVYDEQAPDEETIRSELVRMALFEHNDVIQFAGCTKIPAGFPVPKIDQLEAQRKMFEQVKQLNPDVIFAGRGQPGLFFTNDVLLDVYTKTGDSRLG